MSCNWSDFTGLVESELRLSGMPFDRADVIAFLECNHALIADAPEPALWAEWFGAFVLDKRENARARRSIARKQPGTRDRKQKAATGVPRRPPAISGDSSPWHRVEGSPAPAAKPKKGEK